ncbi:uncharacterized protein [Macrobrachium rosenbergii]|uniref:uncharacterized protein n=1 Tax=Macrobrachium rosenbergii TaxID=79674 RepID=UPI0034D49C22
MAICDANCEFLYVDIGCNGLVSDGGVWDKTRISSRIATETPGLPGDGKPQGSERMLPYVLVADDAFPMLRHILKPFSHQTQSNEERTFSYRLSRARRTVENAFGILANRFRIFLSPINLSPSKVEMAVLACTALQNFLRRDHVTQYTPEGSWILRMLQDVQSLLVLGVKLRTCWNCKEQDRTQIERLKVYAVT